MKLYQLFVFVTMMGLISGCEQQYSLARVAPPSPVVTARPQLEEPALPPVTAQPGPTATPVAPVAPPVLPPVAPVTPPTVPVVTSAIANESFLAATNEVKKIDFLFVIDNSGSMSDNQRKLARGFQAFANTFYRRADLDICTMIITTDRYLGPVGEREYQRERLLPCTKPAGWQSWSPAKMRTHIDELIAEFQYRAYVGTRGSGLELPGKSLVSFLYGLNQWGDSVGSASRTSFFRKDAVANISFLTDENNYFFEAEDTEEVDNDLPYAVNAPVPYSKNGLTDTRKGIKEYIDEYFAALNPERAPTYSVTSLIELNRPAETLPGLAVNLEQLSGAVGRESTKADISGQVEAYTQVYQSIADAIVLRATVFTLTRVVEGDLKVRLRRANGQTVALAANLDYTLQNGNVLTLNPRVLPLLRGGDHLDVSYRYLVK